MNVCLVPYLVKSVVNITERIYCCWTMQKQQHCIGKYSSWTHNCVCGGEVDRGDPRASGDLQSPTMHLFYLRLPVWIHLSIHQVSNLSPPFIFLFHWHTNCWQYRKIYCSRITVIFLRLVVVSWRRSCCVWNGAIILIWDIIFNYIRWQHLIKTYRNN